jgi:prepilin-type N-terminal cleavage/methylation domain-containing protein
MLSGVVMKKSFVGGFSLIELIIVMAIIGVMASVAGAAFQRYVHNTNLKNAARDISTDIQNCKARARSTLTDYLIIFNQPAANEYQICPTSNCLNCSGTATTKRLADAGSGITFDNVGFPGGNICIYRRGTAEPGSVRLKNSRNSIMTITVNFTGKSYVDPDPAKTNMQ